MSGLGPDEQWPDEQCPGAAVDEQTEGGDCKSPAADGVSVGTAADDMQRPAEGVKEQPNCDSSSPAADESSPAADESSPAADESSPAADESSPAADDISDSLHRWVHCVCVVNFDIDYGQVIQHEWPSARLSEEERTCVCFSSFPDSQTAILGDTVFTFRMPRVNPVVPAHDDNEEDVGEHPNSELHDPNFLYGHCFFRQRKDPASPRGCFQQSVVVLTAWPQLHLFQTTVELMAVQYFDAGTQAITKGLRDIADWPSSPDTLADDTCLLFLGSSVSCGLPSSHAPASASKLACNSTTECNATTKVALPATGPQPLPLSSSPSGFIALQWIYPKMWTLWQSMVTGAPTIVLSQTPAMCSRIVCALVHIFDPIPFGGDFRPYLTVHDPQFEAFTSPKPPPGASGLLIGVTNPYFAKVAQEWHNLLILTPAEEADCPEADISTVTAAAAAATFHGPDASAQGGTMEVLWLSKRPVLVLPDQTVIRQIEFFNGLDEGGEATLPVIEMLLSQHFQSLTRRFLEPLEVFCTMGSLALSPPINSTVRTGETHILWLEHFDRKRFLAELAQLEPPPLPSTIVDTREDLLQLYHLFLNSPHFERWWQSKRRTTLVNMG